MDERAASRTKTELAQNAAAAESERQLARWAAFGIPSLTVLGAIGVGMTTSAGPAILVLVAGALLSTIALLWASLRTLSGDAPLPADLEAAAIMPHGRSELAEKKRRVLRALKDLEHEHAVGKIDDKDYGTLGARFREEAKAILRELDAEIEPMREKAEAMAKEHLARRGIGHAEKTKPTEDADDEEKAEHARSPEQARLECAKCSTSNEPDAAFCKKCGTSLKRESKADPK
jgi:hypothetical protein